MIVNLLRIKSKTYTLKFWKWTWFY